ncbi:haloacid dehalogenase type II [Humitalea sp. 24SJ18S-53]|uniref:haloacid dehalogenase type II n=1 Tax=Humitalea sp. 24SJ18S-53 TaxID=3422307 RepID=UPI003D669AFC
MSAPKAVVFDVFGTVVDWRNSIAREAAEVLTEVGRADIDPHAFADAWRAKYQPSMAPIRDGSRPYTRLDVLHRENLDALLADYGIDLPEERRVWLNTAWHRLDPWPDVVAGLTRLKTRYIIAPLSNGNIALMLNLAKRAGIPWDAILGAEVAQAYKPSPQAYLRTAEVLGLAPNEVMLGAAHNSDLAAARKCGLQTGFVARPTEYGPSQKKDLSAEQEWEVVAPDFGGLAKALGC